MNKEKLTVFPEHSIPSVLEFDDDLCNGCNLCVEVCQVDILIPNPIPGKAPIVIYSSECWYDGSCVMACPNPGAIKLNPPLMNRVAWKQKE